jgi:hypothetical protein
MIHLAVASNEVSSRIWTSCLGDAVLAQRMLKANSHQGTVVERYSIILEEMARETVHDPEDVNRPQVFGLTLPAGCNGRDVRMYSTPGDVKEMFEPDGRTLTHFGTRPDGTGQTIKETPVLWCGQADNDGRRPASQEWSDFCRLMRGDMGSLECFLSHREMNAPIVRLGESLRALNRNTSQSNTTSQHSQPSRPF